MGYSHSWKNQRDFTSNEWKKVCDGTRKIIKLAKADGIMIRNGNGEAKPEITPKGIYLNGDASDTSGGKTADGKAYESFCLASEGTGQEWCKTGGITTPVQPYDAVVVSVLRMAQAVAPEAITIGSDGGPEAFDNAPYKV